VCFSVVRPLHPNQWLLGAISGASALAAATLVQATVNSLQVGVFSLNAYSAEGMGFSWLRPAVAATLFGSGHGLFVSSPIVGLGCAGIVAFYSRFPYHVRPFVLHSILQIYVISSWVAGQGDTFGARMWCENVTVIAFGLAYLVKHSSRFATFAIVLAVVVSVVWTNVLLFRYVGVL
jgi:hypothetical protein